MGWVHVSGYGEESLLHTQADPAPSVECNEVFTQVLALLGSSDPALRLETLGAGKYFGVHEDEVAAHTDRRLRNNVRVSRSAIRVFQDCMATYPWRDHETLVC